jgi:CDP-diglyceride synthetase
MKSDYFTILVGVAIVALVVGHIWAVWTIFTATNLNSFGKRFVLVVIYGFCLLVPAIVMFIAEMNPHLPGGQEMVARVFGYAFLCALPVVVMELAVLYYRKMLGQLQYVPN